MYEFTQGNLSLLKHPATQAVADAPAAPVAEPPAGPAQSPTPAAAVAGPVVGSDEWASAEAARLLEARCCDCMRWQPGCSGGVNMPVLTGTGRIGRERVWLIDPQDLHYCKGFLNRQSAAPVEKGAQG